MPETTSPESPIVYIIGGPNGAGKTTFARRYLAQFVSVRAFVNADLIAKDLWPEDPNAKRIRAGRLMVRRMDDLAAQGANFAIESTLAGRMLTERLKRLKGEGYEVKFVYLWIDSVELALARVAKRVREGGHDVPKEIVTRRYGSGLRNFMKLYRPLADFWVIWDNCGETTTLIAYGEEGAIHIEDPDRFRLMTGLAES